MAVLVAGSEELEACARWARAGSAWLASSREGCEGEEDVRSSCREASWSRGGVNAARGRRKKREGRRRARRGHGGRHRHRQTGSLALSDRCTLALDTSRRFRSSSKRTLSSQEAELDRAALAPSFELVLRGPGGALGSLGRVHRQVQVVAEASRFWSLVDASPVEERALRAHPCALSQASAPLFLE